MNCFEKTKIKKERPGMADFSKLQPTGFKHFESCLQNA